MGERILVSGGYGHGNLGDDLLSVVVTKRLLREGLAVVLSAGDRGRLSAEYTQSRWRLLREIGPRTRILLGGGGLFNDAWGLAYSRYFGTLALMAKVRGARFSCAGVGVERPVTWQGGQLLAIAARYARPFGVRDGASRGHVVEYGGRHVILGTDLGWLASRDVSHCGPAAGRVGVIGMSIAGETAVAARQRIGLLADIAVRLRLEYPHARIRLVAMQRSSTGWMHDDPTLLEEVQRASRVSSTLLAPRDVPEALEAWSDVDLHVGYRLHGLLISYLGGARVVALSRAPKVAEAFEGAPGVIVLDQPIALDHVVKAATAVAAYPPDAARVRAHIRTKCESAERHLLRSVSE